MGVVDVESIMAVVQDADDVDVSEEVVKRCNATITRHS